MAKVNKTEQEMLDAVSKWYDENVNVYEMSIFTKEGHTITLRIDEGDFTE